MSWSIAVICIGFALWVGAYFWVQFMPRFRLAGQIAFFAGALFMVPGIGAQLLDRLGVDLGGTPRAAAECKGSVLAFEREVLRQDALMNAAYAPFQRACAALSVKDIPVTAVAAIKASEQCNFAIHRIDIPGDMPAELIKIMEDTRDAAAASCFAKGKIAGNILHQLTGEGEVYSTVESLTAEHENFYVQAGLGLGMAKVMVGISE